MSRRGVQLCALVVVLLFAGSVPATAESGGMVKVDAVFTDYPENLDETPWDIGGIKLRASVPDRGFLRADNTYKDWKYVRSLDPDSFGLDPGSDMKTVFKEFLKEAWLEVELVCVNVIDNRAVVAGQVTQTGAGVYEEWIGTWVAAEFFDMDEFGEADYYEDLRYDPDTGVGPTEEEALGWCQAGDVPVPPDWFYYQRELLSGGIEVNG